MAVDPFDLRCRRCHTPIDLPADITPDDEYCSPTCRAAGPRRNPLACFMAWARRVWRRAATDPDGLDGYGDALAWAVDLRRVPRHEERTLRDWLSLHGVLLTRIADRPGLVEVCIDPHDGAYLCVVLDGAGEFRTRLVMAPPHLTAGISYRHLNDTDIAEGPAT